MKCQKCQFDILKALILWRMWAQSSPSSEETHKGLSLKKAEKDSTISPRGPYREILSQRDRIEGEHKQVTVMFCDMEGFTPLTEELGSEKAYNILDQVFEILIHKVHDYGGTVNEVTGTGLWPFLGHL